VSAALAGKIAIVTGASRGIGRAIAVKLGAAGASVIVNFLRDASAAEATVAEVTALGSAAIAVQADITRSEAARSLFKMATDRFGGADILVCNAGVAFVKPLAQVAEPDYERVFDSNVRSLVHLLREAAAQLRDGGRLITLSSTVVAYPFAGVGLYAASKAAIRTLTEVAAIELGSRGITANCILPGMVETDMIHLLPPAHKETVAQSSPFGRIGAPDDIAGLACFLASDAARWVTGQSIVANGGARR
jgi:3-oxoacyl-[acyl-carrier protein] reductase